MTFLGQIGNQATTPIVKESRNWREKDSNPFVPVTPLVLIWSQRPGLCGKLISSNTCLLETDGWLSWGVIDVFFFSLYLCVCVQCICSLLSLFDGLIWVPLWCQQGFCSESPHWHQLPCGWSENHLQQAYPKHTTAVKGVAWSKCSLRSFYWFPHLRASLLLLITDQGTASCTRP